MAPSCRHFNALVISAFCLFGLGCERNPTGGSQLGSTTESPTAKGEREAEEAILTGKLVLKQYPPLPIHRDSRSTSDSLNRVAALSQKACLRITRAIPNRPEKKSQHGMR